MSFDTVRKVINRFHPRGPNSWHGDFARLSHSNSRLGWSQEIEKLQSKQIDWSQIKAVSEEDYILEDDIAKHSAITIAPQYLHCINNAQVIGPWGDVFDRTQCLLSEFSPQNNSANGHSGLQRTRYPKPQVLSGRTVNLAQPGSSNYYHWLTQIFASLRLLNEPIESIDWFIVPYPARFHLATLKALGISERKVAKLSNSTSFSCETLYQASVSHSISPSPIAVNWLRNTFEDDKTLSDPRVKLYISRSDTGARSVENEDALVAFLNGYGYQKVQLAELNLSQQITLFRRASHIISPHGAGLSNLCFCMPDCKVLEIFPQRWTSLCYLHLSEIVNADYWFCNAEPLGLSKEQVHERRIANAEEHHKLGGLLPIQVPLEKISRFIDQC